MPNLRQLFAPKPPERRYTISGPVPDPRFKPMHEAADDVARQLAAAQIVDTYAHIQPKTQPLVLHRKPALRRVATVEKSEDGLFVSWRRMPTTQRPTHHKKNSSKGEELRVFALKNLASIMRRRRWLSGELLQYDLPTGAQFEAPERSASRPPLTRRHSEPNFRLDLPPEADYVEGYAR